MQMPATIVLDAWAIMAYLEAEPAGKQVKQIISEAQDQLMSLLISTVNAGEVWYNIARRASETEADGEIAALQQLGIRLVSADWTLTRLAAAYKSIYPIAYADCFAAALAKIHDAELITGDPEFKQLEGEVQIHWL